MSGKREVQTRGLIISRTSSGEGSVRVGLFSEELGLVWAVAKSAREERSKLRPHLTVGTFGFFGLVDGRMGWRLVGAVKTRNCYFAFQKKPKAQAAAARLLSLLRQLINGEERDTELFDAVWYFLTSLDSVPEELLVPAERFAILQSLSALGYVSKEVLPNTGERYYSPEALMMLAPYEKQMRAAIKSGFSASGLVS